MLAYFGDRTGHIQANNNNNKYEINYIDYCEENILFQLYTLPA